MIFLKPGNITLRHANSYTLFDTFVKTVTDRRLADGEAITAIMVIEDVQNVIQLASGEIVQNLVITEVVGEKMEQVVRIVFVTGLLANGNVLIVERIVQGDYTTGIDSPVFLKAKKPRVKNVNKVKGSGEYVNRAAKWLIDNKFVVHKYQY